MKFKEILFYMDSLCPRLLSHEQQQNSRFHKIQFKQESSQLNKSAFRIDNNVSQNSHTLFFLTLPGKISVYNSITVLFLTCVFESVITATASFNCFLFVCLFPLVFLFCFVLVVFFANCILGCMTRGMTGRVRILLYLSVLSS